MFGFVRQLSRDFRSAPDRFARFCSGTIPGLRLVSQKTVLGSSGSSRQFIGRHFSIRISFGSLLPLDCALRPLRDEPSSFSIETPDGFRTCRSRKFMEGRRQNVAWGISPGHSIYDARFVAGVSDPGRSPTEGSRLVAGGTVTPVEVRQREAALSPGSVTPVDPTRPALSPGSVPRSNRLGRLCRRGL